MERTGSAGNALKYRNVHSKSIIQNNYNIVVINGLTLSFVPQLKLSAGTYYCRFEEAFSKYSHHSWFTSCV
jgi:hypothetical protein